MTRITPRTCLYPLTCSLLITFGLSIGLTFLSNNSCYAATCGEWLFPLQARIHVIVWYFWVSISVTFLAVRAFSPALRQRLRHPLAAGKIPVIRKHLTVSGVLVVAWVVLLYGIIVGLWWVRLRDYFVARGQTNGIFQGNKRLAAIALTGHVCDVTMGMALIPVSRHSALGSFFKLSVSTTHAFHMLAAYALFLLVLVHACLYVAWVPVFNMLSQSLRMVFPVLNPTYLYHETWPGNSTSLGLWRASLIFTGISTAFIFSLLFFTSLPSVRKYHFNVFYFTHLLSLVAVVVVCLHASTMFYCTSPGLAMWLLDWGMRLYELKERLDGKVSAMGKGWYCLSLPLPRRRLDGCACTSPLAHFYIHHSDSSVRELHPFTTITHLASQNAIIPGKEDDLPIQFLFRKSGKSDAGDLPVAKDGFMTAFGLSRRKRPAKIQWTNKLAGLVDQSEHGMSYTTASVTLGPLDLVTPGKQSSMVDSWPEYFRLTADVSLRLEGPYFTPADPAQYETVVCFVAGTGVSGAIAIAQAFTELERGEANALPGRKPESGDSPNTLLSPSTRTWQKCVINWSVRADDCLDVPAFKAHSGSALEVRVHLTGTGRKRLDMEETLASSCKQSREGSIWVYLSGPPQFIEAGEKACKAAPGVDWYGARWDI